MNRLDEEQADARDADYGTENLAGGDFLVEQHCGRRDDEDRRQREERLSDTC